MVRSSLAVVLRAWELSGPLHDRGPAASAHEIETARRMLGDRLPPDLAELYRSAGAGSFVGGDLEVYPLLATAESAPWAAVTAADVLRSYDWPVPDEMLVFGHNGGGDYFGLWVPAAGGLAHAVVVELGELFEDACLAVVGDDLGGFLLGWSAYYLLASAAERDLSAAVAALGLPDGLRSLPAEAGDDDLFAFLSWANPGLPDPRPDPYRRGLTAEQVNDFVSRR